MDNNIETKSKMKYIVTFVVAMVLGAGLLYACIYFFPATFVKMTTKIEKDVTVNEKGIADAVEKIYDAVVVVSTYKNNTLIGSGTGFVYEIKDDKALIMTNYHVIESGTEIHVTFTNGTQEKVDIEGGDKYSDIAVLSINKDKIVAKAEIGKSDNSRVGDTVFAVGAPLDDAYSWSVTRGILSGKDRLVEVSLGSSIQSGDYVMSVLQTDTAINSGNSGGPLSNSNGEVIGVTSMKLISSGVEGMGFAIPIETAIKYANKILAGDSIERPFLGITMVNVQDAMYSRDYYSLVKSIEEQTGVVVTKVENDSAADNGGLKVGDIITAIDGKSIKSIAYLRYELFNREIGDTIKVEYIRNEKKSTLDIKLTKSGN